MNKYCIGILSVSILLPAEILGNSSLTKPIQHGSIKIANHDLVKMPHNVDQIKNGGEATQIIWRQLVLLDKPQEKAPNTLLQKKLAELISYAEKDAKRHDVAFVLSAYTIEDADELSDELLREKLKDRIFKVSRFILAECRKNLLHMLHRFRGFILPLVVASFKDTHIDSEQSVLVAFMRYSGASVDKHLQEITATREQLKNICKEYIVFSSRLWHSLSKDVIEAYQKWVDDGKPKVGHVESSAEVHNAKQETD